MLFNTPVFIYFFLPASVAAWWWLQRAGFPHAACWWVVSCSGFFYAYWDWRFLPLLVCSAGTNYWLGRRVSSSPSRQTLYIGVALNLTLLGYFKYAGFLVGNWNTIAGTSYPLPDIVMPLGISFFTFQVIAFLVDCHKGLVKDFNFGRFIFSLSFFPHLIAGPILHYSDVMPQIQRKAKFDPKQFSQGLFLLAAGLAKKGVIADRIAEKVDPLYAMDGLVQFAEAWTAAVGYGLQVYFDFSGYTDMAIGIGLMFGIVLPQNFNSPYQSSTIAEFWRRWHMTLSRFLRDYVYVPLGGNRNGVARGVGAAALTMILGGFWHGAAWTFVLWGGIHGGLIGIYRLWALYGVRLPKPVAITLTYLAVTAAWVPFRSGSITQSANIWAGMLGMNGVAMPALYADLCPRCPQAAMLNGLETILFAMLLCFCMSTTNAQARADMLSPSAKSLAWLAFVSFTAFWLPGSHGSFIYWQF